ncbi:MAG: glycosyltransferase family 9 protein [Candidatus Omnitrophota bacterium]
MQIKVKTKCRFFNGIAPCVYHKAKGVHCARCEYYQSIEKKILIIKLGAAGDVIRTTPLLRKLKKIYPHAYITWLTYFPEVLPSTIDNIITFEPKNILPLLATTFDIVYNLDKEQEACALTALVDAKVKKGFILKEGKCLPIDKNAYYKWLTGLFDDVNKKNTKSYVEELFNICGFAFDGEEYVIDRPKAGFSWNLPKNRPLIGLNTGCSKRWPTRLWSQKHWIALAKRLKSEGYGVIFLGGEREDGKNKYMAKKADVSYLGYFPFDKFVSLLDACDLLVTSITMALHIAVGLKKKIVFFNNIFNKHEFETYGRGVIVEPNIKCKGCYKDVCRIQCMELIKTEQVFNICKRLLPLRSSRRKGNG